MKTIIMLFVGLCISWFANAQADSANVKVATIKWSAYEFLDIPKNVYVEHNSYFISHGSEKILWHQREGVEPIEFILSDASGKWVNVHEVGQVKYKSAMREHAGFITLKRDGDWITLKLEFSGVKGGDVKYEFSISEYQIIK